MIAIVEQAMVRRAVVVWIIRPGETCCGLTGDSKGKLKGMACCCYRQLIAPFARTPDPLDIVSGRQMVVTSGSKLCHKRMVVLQPICDPEPHYPGAPLVAKVVVANGSELAVAIARDEAIRSAQPSS